MYEPLLTFFSKKLPSLSAIVKLCIMESEALISTALAEGKGLLSLSITWPVTDTDCASATLVTQVRRKPRI